ncbi:hypothetical protein [Limibacillus sp. MBR-115]|uniref:hypothetical protein n=1 Tax=Limibacillus sp. MBR-115 TaxID=3156465 RepID=UPI003394A81D
MTKPTLYLHIGAGKSGSSSIQAALARCAVPLREQGFLVPGDKLEPDAAVSGHQLWFFQGLPKDEPESQKKVLRRLLRCKKAMAEQECHSLVVSAENLINRRNFPDLFLDVDKHFRVVVIAYLRRQDQYIQAHWQQWGFKSHPDFDDWIANGLGDIANWDVALADWEAAAFKKQIIVKTFERPKLHGNDVVLDFFNILGLDGKTFDLGNTEQNRGFSELTLRIAERNRDLFDGPHDNRFFAFLGEHLGSVVYEKEGGSIHLGKEDRQRLLDRFRAGNERLRKTYFPDQETLFDESNLPERLEMSEAEWSQRERDLIWRLLFAMRRRK